MPCMSTFPRFRSETGRCFLTRIMLVYTPNRQTCAIGHSVAQAFPINGQSRRFKYAALFSIHCLRHCQQQSTSTTLSFTLSPIAYNTKLMNCDHTHHAFHRMYARSPSASTPKGPYHHILPNLLAERPLTDCKDIQVPHHCHCTWPGCWIKRHQSQCG